MADEWQSEAGVPVVDGWNFQVSFFTLFLAVLMMPLEVLLQVGHP